jgi:glycosyltransferase involved in cell wall biosynthesis
MSQALATSADAADVALPDRPRFHLGNPHFGPLVRRWLRHRNRRGPRRIGPAFARLPAFRSRIARATAGGLPGPRGRAILRGTPLAPSAPPLAAALNAWSICPTHDPIYGGIYRTVGNFAQALDARILSFDDGRVDRTGFRDQRPTVRVANRPRPFNRAGHVLTPGMRAEAEAHIANADLVVVHSLFRGHAPWAADWARRHGRRLWSVPSGCLNTWAVRQRWLAKHLWLARNGGDFFERATVIFATAREQQRATPLIGAGRSVVIPWPMPLPSLDDRDKARVAFRTGHGIPADAPLLLFVGRLHPVKRPRETIEAFCRAATPRSHLVLVGGADGVAPEALLAGIPADRAAHVHLLGSLTADGLRQAYLAADGFISLSWQENFGYAVAEAAAYGLPLILAPGVDLAHDLPKSSTGRLACGWLVPNDTLAAAEEAIAAWGQARDHPSLGAPGRAWAGDMLAFARFRERLAELCRS